MGLGETFPIPILGVCAAGSQMGKTTLLTRLIPVLVQQGVRVSVVKHAHHRFDVDYPGKDSFRLREAGAVQTLVASDHRIALMTERKRLNAVADEVELAEALTYLDPSAADLVLVEGFKYVAIPKLEVYRQARGLPLMASTLSGVVAIASDVVLDVTLPVMDLDHIDQIAAFILTQFGIKHTAPFAPRGHDLINTESEE